MRTRVGEVYFDEIGKLSLEKLFEIHGTVKTPMVVFEKDGIIQVMRPLFEEEDVEKLHASLLSSIADLIRRFKLSELFVGYEGFYVMEEKEKAVRVLIGTLYSDDEERTWLAQIHGSTIGEWQDVSDNDNRLGFERVWQLAMSYLRN
jgi:hypothetical protein